MAKLITIAGPQSSGKTILLNYLKKCRPEWNFIDEVNPRTITGKKNFGAINTNAKLERQILEQDIINIAKINRKNKITVIESGIFHYVYALHFLDKKEADSYFRRYLKAQNGFKTYVFFINTDLNICFERRKPNYLKRIIDEGITDAEIINQYLNRYKEVMKKIYPNWLKCYEKLKFSKKIVENNNLKKEEFLKKSEKIIFSFLSEKSF